MMLIDRVINFIKTFPQWPAAWPWLVQEDGRDVLYAIWVVSQDYRSHSKFYGSFPPHLLDRILALFPDVDGGALLHVFSGSLPPGPYTRCDVKQRAELQCSVYDLPTATPNFYALVVADPPYSKADAVQYGTPMIDRKRALRALAQVTEPGGHLAWLDTCWPQHAKTQWLTVGRILVQRSTNHRARVLSIFERTDQFEARRPSIRTRVEPVLEPPAAAVAVRET